MLYICACLCVCVRLFECVHECACEISRNGPCLNEVWAKEKKKTHTHLKSSLMQVMSTLGKSHIHSFISLSTFINIQPLWIILFYEDFFHHHFCFIICEMTKKCCIHSSQTFIPSPVNINIWQYMYVSERVDYNVEFYSV